jgi:hypothetical protein
MLGYTPANPFLLLSPYLNPRAPRSLQQVLCVIFISQLLQQYNISRRKIIVNAWKTFFHCCFYLQAFCCKCGGRPGKSDQ